jgi:hypothetical protein
MQAAERDFAVSLPKMLGLIKTKVALIVNAICLRFL